MESTVQELSFLLTSKLHSLHLRELFSLAFLAYFSYWALVYIYRITFHPLAKFPGPKLAAISYWYEAWYDVFPHSGRYLWKIQELHEQYGPIIRINPYCLHINDAEYYDEIYAGGSRKRDRDTWFLPGMGSKAPMAGSMFMAPNHDHHRQRRSAVGQFFSMKSIRALEPLVIEKVDQAMERLHDEMTRGTVVNLSEVNAGLTLDVISAYCFGGGMKALSLPDYGKNWRDQMMSGASMNPLGRQYPWITITLQTLPSWVLLKIDPLMADTVSWVEETLLRISDILNGKDVHTSEYSHRTIFHEIKDSDLPPNEKTPQRLMGEAFVFFGAGTETSGRNLSTLDFHIINNPDINEKLYQELKQAMPTKDTRLSLDELMKLPYLSACINETLRVGHGVPSRTPRIAPNEDLHYKGWTIPRGSAVTESSYLIHMNPEIFPDPFKYDPQRFIDDPHLTRYLVPFGRGSRACIGQNLARSELFQLTAALFRRYKMELYETNYERDVHIQHDYFIGMSDKKSPGVRVRVIGERED